MQHVLQDTAKEAESLGEKALKYIIPSTVQSGMAVIKPFLKKKRSVYNPQQSSFYQWPISNNNNARSSIGYPNNDWNANTYNYWNTPVQRSDIPAPVSPQYYQQPQYPSNQLQSRTFNDKEAKVKEDKDMKESLQEFKDLVSKVDSALVSYSDRSGVVLKENLKGEEVGDVKKENIAKNEKKSKTPKRMQKEELNKITNTFTDFICGDNC